MKSMKRILPILLCAVMLLGLLPMTAFAATLVSNTTITITVGHSPLYQEKPLTGDALLNDLTITGVNKDRVYISYAVWRNNGTTTAASGYYNARTDYDLYIIVKPKDGYTFSNPTHDTVEVAGYSTVPNAGGDTANNAYETKQGTTYAPASELNFTLSFHSKAKYGSSDEMWTDSSIDLVPEFEAPMLYEGTAAKDVKFTRASSGQSRYYIYTPWGAYKTGYEVYNGSTKLNADDKLQAGVKYRVRFMLGNVDAYYHVWSANPAVDLTGVLYGETAKLVQFDTSTYNLPIFDAYYTVPCMKQVDTLDITGINVPDKGLNPQQTGFTASDKNIDLKVHTWIDEKADKLMTATDTFQAGQKYTLVLEATATKDTYEIQITDPAKVTVNAGTVTNVGKQFQFHPDNENDYVPTEGAFIWIEFTAEGDPRGADLGTILYDLSAGPVLQLPDESDSAWAIAMLIMVSGGYVNSNSEGIDLDKDGHVDVAGFSEGGKSYYKVADNTNLSGKYVVDISDYVTQYVINMGNDAYTSITFILPVEDGNYGTLTYDTSKDWRVPVLADGDPIAVQNALVNTLDELASKGTITKTISGANVNFDLDKDGNPDISLWTNSGTTYVATNVKASNTDYSLTLDAASIASLKADGKPFAEKLIFKLPAMDAGDYTINLTAGDVVIACDNIVEYYRLESLFDGLDLTLDKIPVNSDFEFDLDADGNYDIYPTLWETKRTVEIEILPTNSVKGDITISFTSAEYEALVDAAWVPVYTNVTFKFYTEPVTQHTVTFVSDHGVVPPAQIVAHGGVAVRPADPTEAGWTFGGWYREASCTNVYDFAAPVNSDIKIYAKWTENSAAPTNPFVDVTDKDWFYNAVMWAVNQTPPITNGTDATHFAPTKVCTRAEVVTFLWNAAGQPAVSDVTNPFVDVKTSDWYYKAVMWAVANKVTAGTDATHFTPNKTCTRAEVVQFLRNAAQEEPTSTTNPFVDVTDKDWFYKSVLWAVEKKITAGTDATHFAPNKTCTRAEVVQFLYKAAGN